jgi:hypothetical protein
MYWYPKLKQWLSLNQALYLKSLEANRDNRID